MEIDSAQITNVHKTGLRMYKSLSLGTEKCPLSLLTVVRIKRVKFRENIWTLRRDKRDCP